MSEAMNSPALSRRKEKVISSHVEVHERRRYYGEEDAKDIADTLNTVFDEMKSLNNFEASVVEETEPICSLCGADWDPIRDEDSNVLVCESCGVPVADGGI